MKFIQATCNSDDAMGDIKNWTNFSNRYCSPFSFLKLSTASRIFSCPPLTRQTAASSSITVITVLCEGVKGGVWREEWGVKGGVWREECEGRVVKGGMWREECEGRNVKGGVWREECEGRGVKGEAWREGHEGRSVKGGVWREECECILWACNSQPS